MSVSWNYNGTTTLDVQCVGTAGEWYALLNPQDFTSPFLVIQADGAGAFGTTWTDIHDPGGPDDDPGARNHSFGIEIRHVTDNTGSTDIAWFACNIFYYGEATTAGHKVYAVWTYDGDKDVSVELATITGCDYVLNYSELVGGVEVGGSSVTQAGTGQLKTISVTMADTPDAVNGFWNVTIADTASPFPGETWQIANRMFRGGNTTPIEGNPETPSTTQLVAVGDNPGATSRIQLSNEGIVWTLATDPDPTGTLFGVASGNGVLIACGDGMGIVRSTDSGATWTAVSNPMNASGGTCFGVCYSPDLALWVVGGFASGGDETVITTSSDVGVTWTERASPWQASSDGAFVNEVTWAAGQFVAVGESRNLVVPYSVVMTSPDGITWTNQVTPLDGGGAFGAWYDAVSGLWVADGDNGTDTIITSPDAVTWTSRFTAGVGASGARGTLTNLATATATWASGSAAATSPDAVTWTPQTTPFTVGGANGVTWSDDLFTFPVAAGGVPGGMFLSSDGVGWWGAFAAPGGFTPKDVSTLTSPTPPTKRCRDCGSGLLGTLLRL